MQSSGSYGEKLTGTAPEAKFMTGPTGVQKNPDAPPTKKEEHIIEPPKVSTQHY